MDLARPDQGQSQVQAADSMNVAEAAGRAVPPAPRRSRAWSAGLLACAALLGAVLGGLALGAQTRYTATALVQGAPVQLGGVSLGDSSSRYVREELELVTNYQDKMVAAAAESTGAREPLQLLITNRSATTFLAFQAIAGSAEDAAAMANASAEFYIDEWRQRTMSSLELSLSILDGQLRDTTAGSPSALELTSERTSVRTDLASVEAAERFVSPASEEDAIDSSSPIGGVILGALAGLVVGVLALLVLNRRREARGAEAT